MKKRFASLTLIVGLALVLIVAAGCNRPDSNVAVPTVPAEAQSVQPTLPPVETPTLPPGEMPPGFEETVAAQTPIPPAESTPLPSQPEQPVTPVPAPSTPVPAPVVSTPAPAAVQQTNASGQIVYTVQTGDRLFSIARLYNVSPYAIASANNIAGPGYLIYPGQKLIIPTGGTPGTPAPGTPVPPKPGCRATYVVKPGDNLFRISLANNMPMAQIAAANNITNYNFIYVGQSLCIPQ